MKRYWTPNNGDAFEAATSFAGSRRPVAMSTRTSGTGMRLGSYTYRVEPSGAHRAINSFAFTPGIGRDVPPATGNNVRSPLPDRAALAPPSGQTKASVDLPSALIAGGG